MALSDAAAAAVGAWTLDEASGSRADQVGSTTLTDNNTVASAAGMFSNAADFEAGNSEYLSATDNAALSMGNIDFFVRCWIKPESVGATGSIIQKAGANDIEYDLRLHSTGNLDFRVSSAAGFTNLTAVTWSSGLSAGNWYLCHAWHDAANNQLGIAVNAGTAVTQAYTNGSYDSGAAFRIGAYSDFSEYFDGLIDDAVVLKNYILDATERTEDYNSGTGVAFADWDAGGGTVRPRSLLTLGVGC